MLAQLDRERLLALVKVIHRLGVYCVCEIIDYLHTCTVDHLVQLDQLDVVTDLFNM
jgi:hypothetical protein